MEDRLAAQCKDKPGSPEAALSCSANMLSVEKEQTNFPHPAAARGPAWNVFFPSKDGATDHGDSGLQPQPCSKTAYSSAARADDLGGAFLPTAHRVSQPVEEYGLPPTNQQQLRPQSCPPLWAASVEDKWGVWTSPGPAVQAVPLTLSAGSAPN